MIRRIKTKDKSNFLFFCTTKDKYSDFYITTENQRLFLTDKKVCHRVFNDCLKRGDKCLVHEDGDTFNGIVIVNGYADKFSRKYMKILVKDSKTADDLIKNLTWEFPTDLFIKVKNDNPILEVLLGTKVYNAIFKQNSNGKYFGYGFRLIGRRGKEALLCRKYNERYDYSKKRQYIKEDDKQ